MMTRTRTTTTTMIPSWWCSRCMLSLSSSSSSSSKSQRLRLCQILILLGIGGNVCRALMLITSVPTTATTTTTTTTMATMTSMEEYVPAKENSPISIINKSNRTQQQQQQHRYFLNATTISNGRQTPKPEEKLQHQQHSAPSIPTHHHQQQQQYNGITIRVPNRYEYLLNVPFYIYEEYGVPSSSLTLSLSSFLTLGGKPFHINNLNPEYHIHSVNEIKTKHSDDIYLIVAAMNHPMRTTNPSKAKLFLIPTPFNMLIEAIDDKIEQICFHYYNDDHDYSHSHLNNNNHYTDNNNNKNNNNITKVCNQDFVKYVDTGLANSQWFQRNKGRDHIAIMSHWRWLLPRPNRFRKFVANNKKWKPQRIYKCHLIDFEGKIGKLLQRKYLLAFPSYYVGKRCPLPPPPPPPPPNNNNNKNNNNNNNNNVVTMESPIKKKHDFSMVATLNPIGRPKQFQDRINVCDWIQQQQQQNEFESSSFTMKGCGLGIQCPTLSESRFVIHAMGDTEGSNRPMDAILSHTIPIFTREEQYDVLPTWINWDLISYFADVSNQTTFINDLKHIANDTKLYHEKQQHLISNTDLFDYDTIVPLDTYMYMFQIELFPDTYNENRTSPYTALMLHDDGEQESEE